MECLGDRTEAVGKCVFSEEHSKTKAMRSRVACHTPVYVQHHTTQDSSNGRWTRHDENPFVRDVFAGTGGAAEGHGVGIQIPSCELNLFLPRNTRLEVRVGAFARKQELKDSLFKKLDKHFDR